MDWKQEAVDKLQLYKTKKAALVELSEEIKHLSDVAEGIKGMRTDGVRVKGGASREDMLLDNIVKREELKVAMSMARGWVKRVDRGLAALSEEERMVLEMLFISPQKGNLDRLCEKLCVEQASIYRKRDKALRHFTLVLYGCCES